MLNDGKDSVLEALENYRTTASEEQKAKDAKWLEENCQTKVYCL